MGTTYSFSLLPGDMLGPCINMVPFNCVLIVCLCLRMRESWLWQIEILTPAYNAYL